MAQPNSDPDSSNWQGSQTIASPDAAPVTVEFRVDTNVQQPEQQDAASQLSSSDVRRASEMKADMPVWLSGAASKQQSPSQTRLKWCGCLASSICAHFGESHTLDAEISASSKQWMPLPSFVPDGAQQYQQKETKRCSSSLSEKRKMFREPFNYDIRQVAKLKAQILSHPMYEQLLAEHVGCLRVATPVDHLQTIEAQLATTQHVATRYSGVLGRSTPLTGEEKDELDRFMAAYVLLLRSLKGELQEHVRGHAMEAVGSSWELEQVFISLTGMPIGEGSGATMSDDDEEKIAEADLSQLYDPELLVGGDMNLGLGPLIPTESERSLMDRMRQELKAELKQGYRNRISDVREEIMRKRRAGKLPSDTTAILKKWWIAHSKWPYPTEDEKVRLVHETGLELKQINNWFINQRKRNWHSHSTTASTSELPTNQRTSVTTGRGQSSNVSLTLSCETDTIPGGF